MDMQQQLVDHGVDALHPWRFKIGHILI
jgi:hypothetical protein